MFPENLLSFVPNALSCSVNEDHSTTTNLTPSTQLPPVTPFVSHHYLNLARLSLVELITSVVLQQQQTKHYSIIPVGDGALDLRTKIEGSKCPTPFLDWSISEQFTGYNAIQHAIFSNIVPTSESRDQHWTAATNVPRNKCIDTFNTTSANGMADGASVTSRRHAVDQYWNCLNPELIDRMYSTTGSNLNNGSDDRYFENENSTYFRNLELNVLNSETNGTMQLPEALKQPIGYNTLTGRNSYTSCYSPPLNFSAFAMDQNMVCPICRKCFRFEKNLLRHLQKTHATGTGESVLKCKLCNYTTRHYSNMYVHIRTHTGDKPYSCSACGVSFTQGSSLKLHIKSRHHDNGNYFSLTRKPGKNNLTKLWTRVLKKDLPKYNSLMIAQANGYTPEGLSGMITPNKQLSNWSSLSLTSKKFFSKTSGTKNYTKRTKSFVSCSDSTPVSTNIPSFQCKSLTYPDTTNAGISSQRDTVCLDNIPTKINPASCSYKIEEEREVSSSMRYNTKVVDQSVAMLNFASSISHLMPPSLCHRTDQRKETSAKEAPCAKTLAYQSSTKDMTLFVDSSAIEEGSLNEDHWSTTTTQLPVVGLTIPSFRSPQSSFSILDSSADTEKETSCSYASLWDSSEHLDLKSENTSWKIDQLPFSIAALQN